MMKRGFDDFDCDISERQRMKFDIEGTAVVQQEGRRVFLEKSKEGIFIVQSNDRMYSPS